MLSRSSMYSPLKFHWLRNKGVQVSVCFFTKYRVSEDSRAGKSLRLILVLRETNVESGTASTTTLIEGVYFGNDAFSWVSEVPYDCLKKAERDYASLNDGSSSLCQYMYMFHSARSPKFTYVKSFFFF